MFNWFRSLFRPTIIEVTFTPENPDHIQIGVTDLAAAISYLLEHDYPHDILSELLEKMAGDVARLHEAREEDNVVYPVFPQR